METIQKVPELAAVLTYIEGDGQTGQSLINNVDVVAFTGSVPTGRKVAKACAERLIPVYLELGGKLEDALAKGAVLQTGGKSEKLGGGLFMRPVVLTEVNQEMTIMREETFGPVMPVMRYRTEEEAIELANDTYYGLSASVIAGTEEEAARIGERINAGTISMQDTFLTMFKTRDIGNDSFNCSGLGGHRTGPRAIFRYLRSKSLLTNTALPLSLKQMGGGRRS